MHESYDEDHDDLDLEIIRIEELLEVAKADVSYGGISPIDDYEEADAYFDHYSSVCFVEELERELAELYKRKQDAE